MIGYVQDSPEYPRRRADCTSALWTENSAVDARFTPPHELYRDEVLRHSRWNHGRETVEGRRALERLAEKATDTTGVPRKVRGCSQAVRRTRLGREQ